jgi:hypothetical protein
MKGYELIRNGRQRRKGIVKRRFYLRFFINVDYNLHGYFGEDIAFANGGKGNRTNTTDLTGDIFQFTFSILVCITGFPSGDIILTR